MNQVVDGLRNFLPLGARAQSWAHIRIAAAVRIQSVFWTRRRLGLGASSVSEVILEPAMERGFGQFCPVALASEVLTQRWTLLIIRELSAGSARFSEIRRGVPRISASLLKERLDALERAGIVERRPRAGAVFDYVLTQAGAELKPVIAQVGAWGQRWARDIRPEDLDPGWLVWNIRRRLNTDAMPRGRTVLEIFFTDAAKGNRSFWLVHQEGNVDVCVKPPGFDVDVAMRTSVRTLAEVWRGLRGMREEIAAGRIVVEGKAGLCRAAPGWLLLSAYAPIRQARKQP